MLSVWLSPKELPEKSLKELLKKLLEKLSEELLKELLEEFTDILLIIVSGRLKRPKLDREGGLVQRVLLRVMPIRGTAGVHYGCNL